MYLSEIAPLKLRGTLGVFCSMGVTGGVVVGQIMSLEQLLGTQWNNALSFPLIFLILCTLPYRLFPESPKYLIKLSDRTGAIRELRKLCETSDMVQEEMEMMEPMTEPSEEKQNVKTILTNPQLLLPLMLVCAMQGGQQLSGINAVDLAVGRDEYKLICQIPGVLLLCINLQIHRI